MSILNRLKNSAKTLANNAQNAAKNAAQSAVTGAVNTAQSVVNNAVNAAQNAAVNTQTAAQNAVTGAVGAAQNAANNVRPTVNSTVNAVQGAVNTAQSVASNTANAVQNAAPGIIGSASNAVNTTQNAASNIAQSANQIGSTVKDAGTNLAGSAANAGDVLYNAAGQIVEKPGNAQTVIQNAAGELATEAGNAASTVQNAAGVIAGEANNIYNTAQDAVSSVTNDVNNIASTAQNAANDIFGGIQRENLSSPANGSQAPVAGGTTGTTTGGTTGTTGTGTSGTTGTGGSQTVTSSDLTTADVNARQNTLLQEMMNFWNTPFQYNAKESPLYTILQQQQAKEARLASGRAYSRAVANTGGFGSSYATLSAEEAGRQVMEGWDDQQYDLYQAAKDEWKSKWTNMVEEYNFLTGVQERENAKSSERKQMVSDAADKIRGIFGNTYDEAAIRAQLTTLGLTEDEITQVLNAQQTYSASAQGSVDNALVQEGADYIANAYGTGYNAETMRADLESRGYSKAVIDRILQIQYGKSEYAKGIQSGEYYTTAMSYIRTYYGNEYNPGKIKAELEAMGIPKDVIEQVLAVQEMNYGDAQNSENKELFAQAVDILDQKYGTTYNEAAMRADLQAMGLSETMIKSVLENRKNYAQAMQPLVDNEKVTAASSYLQSKYGTGYNEATMRKELAAQGYSEAVISKVLSIQKGYSDHMLGVQEGEKFMNAMSYVRTYYGTDYNETAMRSELKAMGYSDDIVNQVVKIQEETNKDAQASENKELFAQAVSALDQKYGTTYNEAAMRADLEAMGLSNDMINRVLANRYKSAQAMEEISYKEKVSYAISAAREAYGSDYNEAAMRADLEAMGLTDQQIAEVLANQKRYSDAIKAANKTADDQEKYASAVDYMRTQYGSDYNETAMRADLEAMGFNEEMIAQVLANQKKYSDAIQEQNTETENQKAFADAVSYVREWYGSGYNEAAIRADLQAMGLTDAQITAVLANHKQYSDAMTADGSGEVFAEAVDVLRSRYGSDYNEAAMRADLQAMGLTDTQITAVLANQKQYSDAMKEAGSNEQIANAAGYLRDQYGADYNEAAMRADLALMGLTDAQITAVLNNQKTYSDAIQSANAAEENKQLFANAVDYLRSQYGSDYNEAAMRKDLEAMGLTDTQITAVLENQEQYSEAWSNAVNQEKFANAVDYIRKNYGTTYNQNAISADLFAMGLTSEEVVAVLANQKQYAEAMQAGDTERFANSVEYLRVQYGADYNEAAMRADLEAMGLTEDQISKALANQKRYADAMKSSVDAEVFADAVGYLRDNYGSKYNEAAMRKDLEAMDLTEEQIAEVLENQRLYSEAMIVPGSVSQGASDAYNYILSLGDNGWNGSNESIIRTMLENQAVAGGWTSEDIDKAIDMLKEMDVAQAEESFKQFEQNPTISGAVQIMSEAKATGNTNAAYQQVARIMYTQFANAMNDLDNAYSFIGVDQEAWAGMSEDEREEKVLTTGMEAVDAGILSKDAYGEVVKIDMRKGIREAMSGDYKLPVAKMQDVLDIVSGVMAIAEAGYLTVEKEQELIDIVKNNSFVAEVIAGYGEDGIDNMFYNDTQAEAYRRLLGMSGHRGGR